MSTNIKNNDTNEKRRNESNMIQNNYFYVMYTSTALPFVFKGKSSLYKSNIDDCFIHKCGNTYYQYKRVNSTHQRVYTVYRYKGYTVSDLAHVLASCDVEEAEVLYQNLTDKEKQSKLNIYYQMKLHQYKRYLSSYYNYSCFDFCDSMKWLISKSNCRFKMTEPEYKVFLKFASAALFYAEAEEALDKYRNAMFRVSILPLEVAENLLSESSLVAGGNHAAKFCKGLKKIVEIK
ncbi:MAG: hypothetical protein IJN88_08770 [Clostridia bacterium]|nr:hypothetical protein [Clostridia bacterium]